MPPIDLLIETKLGRSTRVRQLEAMFDVPAQEKTKLRWKGDLPIEQRDWRIGLIVGPSGSGKSTLLRSVFGDPPALRWDGKSVIDDFEGKWGIKEIAEICGAVGFNTIPAWMRPFAVLSNGEKFRVELARRLLEGADPIVVDEFTSVVDRQVAKIGAHAVQKYVRKHNRRFVAASCHYDVIEWLQPDWVLEPATMSFTWREVRRRPSFDCVVSRVPYSTWRGFAPFHYLNADLNPSAACFGLFVDGQIASFAGVLHRPHPRANDVKGVSRLVTLPDFQGLGAAMALVDKLGAAYKAAGLRLHTYPAHPSLVRNFDKSPNWRLLKKPGTFAPISTPNHNRTDKSVVAGAFGGRPNATFEYCGVPFEKRADAVSLIAG